MNERLLETKNINWSLSFLKCVIQAIAQNEKHVPFSNCKLTHVLLSSLTSTFKTLMFVNISPTLKDREETIYSIQFATQVNRCVSGTVKLHVK